MTTASRHIYIKTYGCQMNVYDSTRMADILAPHGFVETRCMADADVILLNTCHIREKAAEKVYSELGRIRPHVAAGKKQGRRVIVGVAGCVAQAEGEEMTARAEIIDMIMGPQAYHQLPAIIARVEAGERVVATDFPAEEKFDFLPRRTGHKQTQRGPTAFVTVQEGCDKFCTFCVVPYTRGAEHARSLQAIVAEVRDLVSCGVKDVMLLGQNVNAYRTREGDLAALLARLAEIPDLARLRYATSHPRDMNDALIKAHGAIDKLMPYLHLPVQSGSDAILKAMNRRHRSDDYRRIIAAVRRARPDIAISGDFIVGFPGETEKDFAATLQLVEDIGYAQGYSFKYSPRPGTPAAEMTNQVAEPVKGERLARLQAVLTRQQHGFNAHSMGRTVSVLLERPGRKPGQLAGRTPHLQWVHLDAPSERLGELVDVTITDAGPHSLSGLLAATPVGEPGDGITTAPAASGGIHP